VALPDRVDVVVVGAGTAGAAAASRCARRGLSVLCVERRPLDAAGARWVNGVPAESFDLAGFARPERPERMGDGGPFHLVAGHGPTRVRIEGHGVLEVDMRRLVERLQRDARERGATLVGEASVEGLEGDALRTARGTVRCRWVVDASGLTGARLLDRPEPHARHMCAAAQAVHELADLEGARSLWERHGVPFGETLCFTGIEGGYSILNVSVHDGRVSVLTGSIPAEGHASGARILSRFVDDHRWVGGRVFGGSRAIPIRRPFDRLTDGRVVLLGDAGSQVFPAHGSGIGAGMVAARELADALADREDAHGWAVEWQRRWGALFASYDLFRRFAQTLAPNDLERMIASGLMDEETARAGLAQRYPSLPARSLPGKARALVRERRIAARLGAVGGRMAAARALYASYPRDPLRLPRWSASAGALFGEAPDVR